MHRLEFMGQSAQKKRGMQRKFPEIYSREPSSLYLITSVLHRVNAPKGQTKTAFKEKTIIEDL